MAAMIDEAVSKLVTYALRTGLIQENETVWAVNTILDALKLDSYTDPGKEWEELELAPILEELLDDAHPDFDTRVDPKCSWALRHMEQFPVEASTAEYETLLRVPGIGPISARRIVSARRHGTLRFEDLKKLGVVLKRAQFFITCGGRMRQGLQFTAQTLQRQLEAMERGQLPPEECRQLSLFDSAG